MAAPDPTEFRQAVGRLPAGVTVVTVFDRDQPAGATASAVCSLSLEPMLMLACLDRGSRTLRAIQVADRFGINVLAADQESIANGFATKEEPARKWAGLDWSPWRGVPAIDRALAGFSCELRDVIEAGDHVILTGRVLAVEEREGDPLIHHRGRYRALARAGG